MKSARLLLLTALAAAVYFFPAEERERALKPVAIETTFSEHGRRPSRRDFPATAERPRGGDLSESRFGAGQDGRSRHRPRAEEKA